jgi:hypothetical protein
MEAPSEAEEPDLGPIERMKRRGDSEEVNVPREHGWC